MKHDWEYKKIGDICIPKKNIQKASNCFDANDEILYIDISSIDNKSQCLNSVTNYIMSEAPSRAQQCVKSGDIIISTVRPNLKNIAIVNKNDNNLVASSGFCVLRPNNIERNYLFHYITSDKFTNHLMSLTNGANYPAVRDNDILESTIPVPPLPTQQSIVSELDSLSKIIADCKETLKDYDALEQSIFYDMFGDPVKNEKGWEVKKLGEVCDVRDGTHDSPKYLEKSDYILITSKNIVNGKIDYSNINYISKDDYDAINLRSNVEDGDIIMAMIGTIGNPIIVRKEEYNFCIKNVALMKFAKATEVGNVYIRALLDNKMYSTYISGLNKGGTQKFLALGTIRNLLTPIPPLPLQQQFASKIEAIEQMKEETKKALQEAETLFQARMDYWFG